MSVKTYKEVVLFKGRGVARVSIGDYKRVIAHSWALSAGRYAIASFDKGARRVYLHRFIMGVDDPKLKVDHKDGDCLNCIRTNLRLCTTSQNSRNRHARTSKSGYKGVYYSNKLGLKKPWVSAIRKDYKQHYLGYFESPEEAALAYNVAALSLHGEFANLNKVKI